MITYKRATIQDLEKIWSKDIQNNLDDERYIKWKQEFIEANQQNNIITFVVSNNDEPIGQASIVLNNNNIKYKCKNKLCNGQEKAYLSTLRIEKNFEGKGHMSKLVKTIEDFAKDIGIKSLSIGVEACETRNLAIYLHLGYTKYLTSCIEENKLILFYEKKL